MPHVEVNGLRLHHEAHGEGPPMILVHGYAAGTAMWRHQVPVLSPVYRVHLYDARGHGKSEAPEGAGHYALQHLVDDLEALMDALAIPRAHLVGHSMGGATVAAFAAARPERVHACVICNIDAGHQRWTDDEERANETLRRWKLDIARERGIEALAREQLDAGQAPAFVTADPDELDAWLVRYRLQPLAGYLGVGEALPWREPWLEEAARRIAAPVCIIAGEDDSLFSGARRLHEHLPGSRFVPVPGAPHDSMNARPSVFNDALLDFLASVDAEQGLAAT